MLRLMLAEQRLVRVRVATFGTRADLVAALRPWLAVEVPAPGVAVPGEWRLQEWVLMLGSQICFIAFLTAAWRLSAWHAVHGVDGATQLVLYAIGLALVARWRRKGVTDTFIRIVALGNTLFINFLLLPPLLLEAGWRHAEEIELRFVAIERGQQVWALPDHEKRITADWPDPAPPNADSRWRLTVWRGPLGTLAIPRAALRAAEQGVAGRV